MLGMEPRLGMVISKVHGPAPKARLIIVDYATILRSSGVFAVVLLSVAQADSSRGIARRLNEITVRVAKETGKELIRANSGHGAIKIENNNRLRASRCLSGGDSF